MKPLHRIGFIVASFSFVIGYVNFTDPAKGQTITGGLLKVGASGSSGSGTCPAGSNMQVQYNSSGSCGGDATFYFDPSAAKTLYLDGASLNFSKAQSSSQFGIIYKNSLRWFHDYSSDGNGNNIFLGLTAGNLTLTGTRNYGFGLNTLKLLTTGYFNIAMGSGAGSSLTTGHENVAIGDGALSGATTAVGNVAVGSGSGGSTTGSQNVSIGFLAGAGNTTGSGNIFINTKFNPSSYTGATNNTIVGTNAAGNGAGTNQSNNVFLGYSAGLNEQGSDKFYVDNQVRGSLTDDTAKSLIYGTFNATPALQTINLNAAVLTRYGVKTEIVAVLSLPTCDSTSEGLRYGVNDALAPVPLATVVTGGSVHVGVYCDGTNWIVQ